MKSAWIGLLFCVGASAQWDSTGNMLLNGDYYFREVIVTSSASVALYGHIVFNGSGGYTTNAVGFQCTTSCAQPGSYQTTGTYSVASSGFGFLSQPVINSQVIGSVGSNGVFIGSATESGYYDLFIAAPVSGQSLSTLQGSYNLSYVEPYAQTPYGALLQFSSNGGGTIGNVAASIYVTSATPITQTMSGVKYIASNNSFKVTFPNSNTNVITGDEYIYSTPDGSFIFGGAPNDFDMFVGVRTVNGAPVTLSGLYYEAGMDFDDTGASTGTIGLNTYYGSFSAASSTIVGHQRIQDGSSPTYGYVYHDTYPVELGSTYSDLARSRQFIIGDGVRVGVGIGPYPALTVAVQAPKIAPLSSGIFLDPTSAVNTLSSAPFTTGISSGELITLRGANLGPAALAVVSTIPLPKTVGGVQVLINNQAVPILMANATQIVIQVPYHVAVGIASIQVSYKGALSNTITSVVNITTPGVLTQPLGGVSRAAAHHPNGSLVTPSSPAKIGESLTVFLTGLGDPSVNLGDGAAGPVVTPAKPAAPYVIYVGGVVTTPTFLALAPGLVGLYQMQFPVPPGLSTGDVFLDIASTDAYSSQAILSVSSSISSETTGTAFRQKRPARSGVNFWRGSTMGKTF